MTKSTNVSNLINVAAVAAGRVPREPKLNDSVFIGFATDGNGKRLKKAAEIPFDKIVGIYADKETGKNGNPVFSVQVASGDLVKVVDSGKSAWQAVA